MFRKFYEMGGSVIYKLDFYLFMLQFKREVRVSGGLGTPRLIFAQFLWFTPWRNDISRSFSR